jgi:hypothetical protein
VRLVCGSHLRCKRLKSLAKKVKVKRFRERFIRSVIVSFKPLQPKGALYALIIISNKELQACI